MDQERKLNKINGFKYQEKHNQTSQIINQDQGKQHKKYL